MAGQARSLSWLVMPCHTWGALDFCERWLSAWNVVLVGALLLRICIKRGWCCRGCRSIIKQSYDARERKMDDSLPSHLAHGNLNGDGCTTLPAPCPIHLAS